MRKIRVANIKTYHEQPGETAVYIGRQLRSYKESVLANPNKLKPGATSEERAECLAEYERIFTARYSCQGKVHAEIIRLARIASVNDLVLLCWCKPAECHGDIIKRTIDSMIN